MDLVGVQHLVLEPVDLRRCERAGEDGVAGIAEIQTAAEGQQLAPALVLELAPAGVRPLQERTYAAPSK